MHQYDYQSGKIYLKLQHIHLFLVNKLLRSA